MMLCARKQHFSKKMLKLYGIYFILVIFEVSAGRKTTQTEASTANPLSNILSKFHQSDYKISFERSEYVRSDKRVLDYHVHTFKYNRTTTAVNSTIFAKMDVGYNIEIVVQAYRFASNEYRLFPLRFQFNLCEAISTQAIGYSKFSENGNLTCPILKGKHYHFYNWSPEETNLPPFIPTGRYMLELQFEYHSHEILMTREYGSVYRPLAYN